VIARKCLDPILVVGGPLALEFVARDGDCGPSAKEVHNPFGS